MLSKRNPVNPEQDEPNPYQRYLDCARNQDENRMGYPLTGSINGFFSTTGWHKSNSSGRLIDQRSLGISRGSISDTLILNIGDPEPSRNDATTRHAKGLYYPEVIENEVISMLASHCGATNDQLKGYVTSGGTEANLACVWWLRNYLTSHQQPASVVLYTSDQSHYSCAKVCQILNIELVTIKSLPTGQIDPASLTEKLSHHMQIQPQRPMIIWLNAGTTVLGAVDDLVKINKIIQQEIKNKNGLCVTHLDGAILGVTLPLVYPEYQNLFQLTDSLSISGHKLLATTLACGVALVKRDILVKAFSSKDISVGYVHGIKDITISGGRSALPIFQLHLSLKKFGFDKKSDNFKKLIHTSLKNAKFLANAMKSLVGDDKVIYNPNQFNVIFPLTMPQETADTLMEKYTLMPLPDNKVCITVFPNVDSQLICNFIDDYRAILNEKNRSQIRARL